MVEIEAMMVWWVLDSELGGYNGGLNLERIMVVDD